MRILLLSLIISWATSASANPQLPGLMSSRVVRSSYLANQLEKSVHQMVASGYALYSGHLPSVPSVPEGLDGDYDNGVGNLFILQNELVNGQRVYSKSVYGDEKIPSKTTTIQSGGMFFSASNMVLIDSLIIFPNQPTFGTTDDVFSIELANRYRLERANDTLLRASSHKGGLEFHIGFEKNNNYRIWQGQREIDNEGTTTVVTETITINGYNPYVIYRHTSRTELRAGKLADRPINEELSVGIYPFAAINPFKVEAKVIETRQYQASPRPVSTEISYNFGDNNLTELRDGEVAWTVDLQLVEDSDIWLEFEGNPGFTGAGLESLLVQQLLDKGRTNEALIAERLRKESQLGEPFMIGTESDSTQKNQ